MNEAVAALIGAAVVGFFTLAGVYLQNKHHGSEVATRLEHERDMAKAAFERERVAEENQWLSARIAEQLSWGDRISRAVGRAEFLLEPVSNPEQRTKILGEVWAFAGLKPDATSPLADLLDPDLLEDGELKSLVRAHKRLLEEGLEALTLADYHPDKLPRWEAFHDTVAAVKKQVALRARSLQREGKPL